MYRIYAGTKKSEKSVEKSPKNRFSVGLEKKNAWKFLLLEKSVENRIYRRFIGFSPIFPDFFGDFADISAFSFGPKNQNSVTT